MAKVDIEYCGRDFLHLQATYQVISAFVLAVVVFTNQHTLDFFFFTVY